MSDRPWWTHALQWGLWFLVMSLVPLIAEGRRVRHELSDDGIAYRGLLRRYDTIAWSEIESAHWSQSMKWFVLKTRGGRVLRFSGLLSGLQSLALALEKVPDLHTDKATAEVLANARGGVLPSVWL